ncbi:hypothetical protein THRCLA_00654 [Thraustotheca clavata]|uniref:FYVE-type domain-containing protein n=1 Tax=Thraustotheca clavata TaxID=74557 RepID=A0A1W0AAL9_9STRA|nr:hypothetical protein THRCLA_00654 [Thraustotheca clavata]
MRNNGLPKEFYNRPDLTRQETEFLVNLAKEMCMEVIFYAQENGGTVKWRLMETKQGVQIFQGEEFGGNDDLTYVCGVNTIKANLAEVADIFNIVSEEKLAEYSRVFEPDLIDMLSIYDLATPTPDNPMHYIGVRWAAVESTSPLVRNRDFCYLECQDEFVDTRTGRQGWVRCMHSINIPSCVSLEKTLGYVRGSYYRSGFVFVETDKPGYLDVTHILQVNFKGRVPPWIKRQTLRHRVQSISRIDKFFQMKKLSAGRILGDIDLPSKKHVTHCHWCSRKFDMIFTRKFRCRKCGEVVCKHCSTHWDLFLPYSGEKRVRICTMCSNSCRNDPDPNEDRLERQSNDQYAPEPHYSMSSQSKRNASYNRSSAPSSFSGIAEDYPRSRPTSMSSMPVVTTGGSYQTSQNPPVYKPPVDYYEAASKQYQSSQVSHQHPLSKYKIPPEAPTFNVMKAYEQSPFGDNRGNPMHDDLESMYETNPFERLPQNNQNMQQPYQHRSVSTASNMEFEMPELQNRMRARRQDDNQSKHSFDIKEVNAFYGDAIACIKQFANNTCNDMVEYSVNYDMAPLYSRFLEPESHRRMELHKLRSIANPKLICIIGHTVIRATLDEISIHLRSADNTYVGPDLIDIKLLHTVELPTKDKPWQSTRVHWLGLRGPDGDNLEYCVVEAQSSFTSPVQGLVRVFQSINLPYQPRAKFTHGDFFQIGHVFTEISPKGNELDCFSIFVISCITTPPTHHFGFARQIVTSIMNLQAALQTHRLTLAAMTLVNLQQQPSYNTNWMESKKLIRKCGVCQRQFSCFQRKLHCDFDGRVVCSSCVTTFQVYPSKNYPLRLQICIDCIQSAILGNILVGQNPSLSENSLRHQALSSSKLKTDQKWRESQFQMPHLPLPSDFFSCPPLDAIERQSLVAEARDACRDTIRNAKALAGTSSVYQTFTDPKTQRQLTIRMGTDLVNGNFVCMSAHTQVNCSLDAIAAMYSHNATSFGPDPVLGTDVLDKVLLYELVQANEVARAPLHAVYMQWMALRTPPVIADRDFCFLECHDEFLEGKAKQRGFVRSLHSIDASCCPPLDSKFGLTRAKFLRSGQVFIESIEDPSVLDSYHVLVLELCGNVPKDIQVSVMLAILLQAANLDAHFRAQELSSVQLVSEELIRGQPKASYCRRCNAPFRKNIFQSIKQYRCRMCGHAICRACHHVWQLGDRDVRICISCADVAKKSSSIKQHCTMFEEYVRTERLALEV